MTKFETTTCGRCGGGGRYSFNLMHGDICYGCSGSGLALTKRAKVARAWFIENTHNPVADIKPGWLFWDDMLGKKAAWLPVLDAGLDTGGGGIVVDGVVKPYFIVKTRRGGIGLYPEGTARAMPSAEAINAKLAEALELQNSLDEKGKPPKAPRKKAVAA